MFVVDMGAWEVLYSAGLDISAVSANITGSTMTSWLIGHTKEYNGSIRTTGEATGSASLASGSASLVKLAAFLISCSRQSHMVSERETANGQETKKDLLLVPNHNFGKDEYVIDIGGHEAQHCQGTESGLLGVFEFQGAFTAEDGSYDTGSRSMGTVFCDLNHHPTWLEHPNTTTPDSPPRTRHTTLC
jgi:hypothetical protein